MLDDLFIINEGGQLLFSFHPKDADVEITENRDDLISGFLTALNTFATFEKGEDLKALKLKETNIIFEKSDEYLQNLMFVITTKNEKVLDLLKSIVQEIMKRFTDRFKEDLEREFDGMVSKFAIFHENVEEIIQSYGLDIAKKLTQKIDGKNALKSLVILNANNGNILYIHAKQYVNKEKITFLIPLISNSVKLLYRDNLNEPIQWILLRTIKNEGLVVEIRDKVLVVKQYESNGKVDKKGLDLDLIENLKKIKKKLDQIDLDSRIKQVFAVNLDGMIKYSQIYDNSYDCSDYIPETISVFISSRKACNELYSKELLYSSIGGEKILTICVNLKEHALILICNMRELNQYEEIHEICVNILNQLS
ncbi:MAG: hypothetical protein GF383_03055 [Candidatus Lokiarchaeota archaeon]|nr:hypothetical protein [Candidatus Lokiarchaeota archaeon]MBD3338518.1 hypothetical protein [Candidatus Lokiarchaeota archaeon]